MSPRGLYVHVPFCDGKCRYCAFYSVAFDPVLADAYVCAIETELALLAERFPAFRAETVYFGGGTPTVLSESQLGRLGDAVRTMCVDHVMEWTVEANPGSLDKGKLDMLRQIGVNRVSLGVQSFSDSALELLGRRHTAEDATAAVALVRAAGIERLSLDLIAGVPGVNEEEWRNTIGTAAELDPGHMSVYSLTLEEHTELHRMAKERKIMPSDEENQLDVLRIAESDLCARGYRRYEISNYAVPGDECIHNVSCWQGGEYLGLGPAAASHIGEHRWTNSDEISAYTEALADGIAPPLSENEELTSEQKASELLVFGLRTSDGVSIEDVVRRSGVPEEQKQKWIAVLVRLSESGLIFCHEGMWVLTARGRDLADAIAVELMT